MGGSVLETSGCEAVHTAAGFPLEALDLARGERSAPTHDITWEYDSFDLDGNPCVEQGSLQAYTAKQAQELAAYCAADRFKRNVQVVPRVRS